MICNVEKKIWLLKGSFLCIWRYPTSSIQKILQNFGCLVDQLMDFQNHQLMDFQNINLWIFKTTEAYVSN